MTFPNDLFGQASSDVQLFFMKKGFMTAIRKIDEPIDKSTLAAGYWWMIIRVDNNDTVVQLEEISNREEFEQLWLKELTKNSI